MSNDTSPPLSPRGVLMLGVYHVVLAIVMLSLLIALWPEKKQNTF